MNRTYTEREALANVVDFVARMKAILPQWDFDNGDKAMRDLLEEIEQFDDALGSGLSVGRLVSWPTPDGGNASYFVTAVGKSYVRVVLLPNLDGLESPVVVDGRAMRQAIEYALGI